MEEKGKTVKETRYERLKRLRKQTGMSQNEIAKALGITQVSYCNEETGKSEAPLYRYWVLADIYNESLEYLIRLDHPARQQGTQYRWYPATEE